MVSSIFQLLNESQLILCQKSPKILYCLSRKCFYHISVTLVLLGCEFSHMHVYCLSIFYYFYVFSFCFGCFFFYPFFLLFIPLHPQNNLKDPQHILHFFLLSKSVQIFNFSKKCFTTQKECFVYLLSTKPTNFILHRYYILIQLLSGFIFIY